MNATRLVNFYRTTICTGVVTMSQMLNELRVALSNSTEELEQASLTAYYK